MSIIETAPVPPRTQRQTLRDWTFDGVISALWRQKLNTKEIAAAAHLQECDVANRIAFLRDAGRL